MTPRPLRELLEDPTDEARIARSWAEIRARRERTVRAPARGLAIGSLVAIGCLGALAVGLWPHAPQPALRASSTTALRLAADAQGEGAGPLAALSADEAPRTVTLDDGSSIALERGARVEPLENAGDRVSLLLTRGAARFAVRPGGPRRWTVESGLATVEVVGTIFRVERRASGVRVEVERGVVVVRGERVPDRVARLEAGETLEVPAERAEVATLGDESAPPTENPAPERIAATPTPLEAARADATPTKARREPRVREPRVADAPAAPLASAEPQAAEPRGTVHLATPELGPSTEAPTPGPHTTPDSLEVARAEADRLRRVSLDIDSPRAAAAAFGLGVIEMDRLGRPHHARLAFVRSLALGLAPAQAREARRRLARLDARPAALE